MTKKKNGGGGKKMYEEKEEKKQTCSKTLSGIVTVKAFQFKDEVKGTCVLSLMMTGTQPAAIASYTRLDVVVSPLK
jgi:hypothetical protein